MDVTECLIDAVMKETRQYNPNHYNICLAPEIQATISKLKSIDERAFKCLKKLVEVSGHFFRIKENLYRDLRIENTVVFLRCKPTKLRQEKLEELQEAYPTMQIKVLTFNTSSDTTTIPLKDGGTVELFSGEDAEKFLFGDEAGHIRAKLRAGSDKFLQSLIDSFHH